MEEHRRTCINRLAELGEDPALYAAVIYALSLNNTTQQLSLAVQAVMELRDSLADAEPEKAADRIDQQLRDDS